MLKKEMCVLRWTFRGKKNKYLDAEGKPDVRMRRKHEDFRTQREYG